LSANPWADDIPGRYRPGDVKKGKVTKLTGFGAFVELEPGLEGLLHLTEMADQKVERPEEVIQVGEEVEVRVLRVDGGERRVGLSRKQLAQGADAGGGVVPEAGPRGGSPRRRVLRGGTSSGTGPAFSLAARVNPEGSEPGAAGGPT
jgi:small subunit ribosomal protein S1